MRIAYVARSEALSTIKNVAPEDLLQELYDRGAKVIPPLGMLESNTKCPHCGLQGKVSRDFGVRIMGGTVRPQSWCRECRKNPNRISQPKSTPQTKNEMLSALTRSLIKAGVKNSELKKLQKLLYRSSRS